MSTAPEVAYDLARELATFSGPGGFTQVYMIQRHARGIAHVLGLPFTVTSDERQAKS